jgi:hypothetical protein
MLVTTNYVFLYINQVLVTYIRTLSIVEKDNKINDLTFSDKMSLRKLVLTLSELGQKIPFFSIQLVYT